MTKNDRELRKARRRRLTERLEALRERAGLIELELKDFTGDFFRVCIFGSARIKPHDLIYRDVQELAFLLGQEGVDVLTGGGPGLMEAANIGVREGQKKGSTKSKSFGISIALNKMEVDTNDHLDIKHHHKKFSSRLDDFMRLSNAIVVTPGGIGTLLELFFSWQLLQVNHIDERPIVLLGKAFWTGLIEWIKAEPLHRVLISPEDMRWIHIADTPQEVMEVIRVEHQKFKDAKTKQNEVTA